MTRIRARVAIFALILVLPAAVAGCGGDGGGGGEDPNEVLDQTFNNPEQINSGQLSISLDGSAEGDSVGEPDGDHRGAVPDRRGRPDGVPAAGSERSGQRLRGGSELRLRRRPDRHRGQRLRRVPGTGVRGRLVPLPAVQDRLRAVSPAGPGGTGQPERLLGLRAVRGRPPDLVDQPLERGRRGRGGDRDDPHPRRRRCRADLLRLRAGSPSRCPGVPRRRSTRPSSTR